MAIDALVKPFLRLPLFQGLKPLQLTEIVRRAHRVVYKPGDTLIQEDKTGDAAIIIVSGEAARITGSDEGSPADMIIEGSIVAELAMLVETVHSATIVARTQVRALKISREDMHAQMSDDPHLAEHMMEKIASRLRRLAIEVKAIDSALAGIAKRDATAAAAPNSRSSNVRDTAAHLH